MHRRAAREGPVDAGAEQRPQGRKVAHMSRAGLLKSQHSLTEKRKATVANIVSHAV